MRLAIFALATSWASAWYLPGIAVQDYTPGEQVWLKVNSLTSPKTQIPYGCVRPVSDSIVRSRPSLARRR